MRNLRAVILLLLLLAASAPAATFIVTNTNDVGAGSLRQAITDANAAAPATVAFSIGSGVQTINPGSPLPLVAQNVTIDGTTQPGYSGTPLIELNDSLMAVSPSAYCLAASGTIRALALNRCSGSSLVMYSGRVTACFIGTDVTGRIARPNRIGLSVLASSLPPAQIGGNSDGEGNLISGNGLDVIVSDAPGTEVSHNKIGTDITGEATLAFNATIAISVQYTQDVSIHDNLIGAHNVGIECFYADRTLINNNYLGVSASGIHLPNSIGIHVSQSNDTEIGTTGRNVIAYNTIAGIEMNGDSIRNTVRGNSIHHNGIAGIDLSSQSTVDGATANDPGDGDTGPNLLQNYPVLTNITSVAGLTTITGTINTTPNQTISLDFYASSACSSTGYGEGETYLIGGSAQTDRNGNGSFVVSFSAALAGGTIVSATATDPVGNTSEFSACALVQGPGNFVFSTDAFSATEDAGNVTVTVKRTNGALGSASVNYATADGTAINGSDYMTTSGSLTFGDGETSKTFMVPIIDDAIAEGNESFVVALSAPANGAALGTPQAATVNITDDETLSLISIADAQLIEGNSGSANMLFTVTLTGVRPGGAVTVRYSTTGNTASAGADFQSVGGTLTFNPGETLKTISVLIPGDTALEPDETFFVTLLSPVNATIARGTATGTIVNDDGGGPITASDVRIVEGNSGTTNAVITLTASQPFSGEVDFFTVDGTAKSGSDYIPRTSFVTFNNETTKTITVPITGDTFAEPDETFTVQMSLINANSPLVFLVRQAISVTIVNDDAGIGPARLIIPAGSSLPLTVNVAVASQPVTFTSSDPSIATIPATVPLTSPTLINVTGVRAGDATITATFPAGFGPPITIDVFVYDRANLVLTPSSSLFLTAGTTATITAKFNPALTVTEEATLSTSGLGVIAVPDRVSIGPGQTATFTIKALTRGPARLSATLGTLRGNAVTSLVVNIADPITTPAIKNFAPFYGPIAGGTTVLVNGSNFRPECTIRFGAITATNIKFISATAMAGTTPPHAAGDADVSVACGFDLFTSGGRFNYLAAPATLDSISPRAGSTDGDTFVAITGRNIYPGCWPFFDGIPARAVSLNSTGSMAASTPAHTAAAAVPVLLRCAGSSDALFAGTFTYANGADGSPVITSLDGYFGSRGGSVGIRGVGFRLDDVTTFDGVPTTVIKNSQFLGQHYVRVPDLPPGKKSITVTDYAGHASTTGPVFQMGEGPAPGITNVSPAITRPANEVTLDGNFRTGYTFTIGDQPATLVTMSDYYSQVVLRVPQLDAGSYGINMLNTASEIVVVGPKLTVLPAGLEITRVSPACVTMEGGARMTINGSGFAPGAIVTIDGSTKMLGYAGDAVVTGEHTIEFTLPPLPTMLLWVDTPGITVTNPNGDSASLTNAFSAISPFDPNGCTPRGRPARH